MAAVCKGGRRDLRRKVCRIMRIGRGLISPGYAVFRIVRDEIWPHL
jgi:hypothetical protein